MATMKRKHSLTPSQIYIKLHTKGLFTDFLLLSTLCQAFKNKLQGMLKDRKQCEESKHEDCSHIQRHVGIIRLGI